MKKLKYLLVYFGLHCASTYSPEESLDQGLYKQVCLRSLGAYTSPEAEHESLANLRDRARQISQIEGRSSVPITRDCFGFSLDYWGSYLKLDAPGINKRTYSLGLVHPEASELGEFVMDLNPASEAEQLRHYKKVILLKGVLFKMASAMFRADRRGNDFVVDTVMLQHLLAGLSSDIRSVELITNVRLILDEGRKEIEEIIFLLTKQDTILELSYRYIHYYLVDVMRLLLTETDVIADRSLLAKLQLNEKDIIPSKGQSLMGVLSNLTKLVYGRINEPIIGSDTPEFVSQAKYKNEFSDENEAYGVGRDSRWLVLYGWNLIIPSMTCTDGTNYKGKIRYIVRPTLIQSSDPGNGNIQLLDGIEANLQFRVAGSDHASKILIRPCHSEALLEVGKIKLNLNLS
jgi:hypothetical protein